MSIVGVGVDHKELVNLAKKYSQNLPEGGSVSPSGSKYIGGRRICSEVLIFLHCQIYHKFFHSNIMFMYELITYIVY